MSDEQDQGSLHLLTITEAAKRAGVNRPLFLQAVESGDIPVLRFGSRRRIDERTLQAYVRSQLEQARVPVTREVVLV